MVVFGHHKKGSKKPLIPSYGPVEERLILAAENRGITLTDARIDSLERAIKSSSWETPSRHYVEAGLDLRPVDLSYFAGIPTRQIGKIIKARLAIAHMKRALYNLDFTPTTESKGMGTKERTRGEVSDIVLGGLHALQNHSLLVDIGEYDPPAIIGNKTNLAMASLAIKRLGFEKVWSDGKDNIVIVNYPVLQEHLFAPETTRYEAMLQEFQAQHMQSID